MAMDPELAGMDAEKCLKRGERFQSPGSLILGRISIWLDILLSRGDSLQPRAHHHLWVPRSQNRDLGHPARSWKGCLLTDGDADPFGGKVCARGGISGGCAPWRNSLLCRGLGDWLTHAECHVGKIEGETFELSKYVQPYVAVKFVKPRVHLHRRNGCIFENSSFVSNAEA